MKKNLALNSALLFLVLAGISGVSLCSGPWGWISPGEAAGSVIQSTSDDTLSPAQRIVVDIRLPRLLLALFCGAALGMAGTLIQALFLNPLAEPYLVGVSAGAALGAVAASLLGWGTFLGTGQYAAGAFAGALFSLGLVFLLAVNQRGWLPDHLLLAGIAVSGILQAIATALLLQADPYEMRNLLFWLMGSFAYRGADTLPWLISAVVLGGVAAWPLARPLDLLATGSLSATSLGLNTRRIRLLVLLLVSLLAAAATAACGIVAFVGLMVPHIGRTLFGASHPVLLPVSAIGGAILTVAADLLARSILPGRELPLSVVTGAVGCAFFISLLLRRSTPFSR